MWRLYNYVGIENSLLTASKLQIRKNGENKATLKNEGRLLRLFFYFYSLLIITVGTCTGWC